MYFINEEEVKKEDFHLPVENLAVWRGDGVFEALKIHDRYPFGIEKHIDRLKQSCRKQLFENVDFSLIENNISKIASQYENGYVRILILRNDCRWKVVEGDTTFVASDRAHGIGSMDPERLGYQLLNAFFPMHGDFLQDLRVCVG